MQNAVAVAEFLATECRAPPPTGHGFASLASGNSSELEESASAETVEVAAEEGTLVDKVASSDPSYPSDPIQ